MSLKINKQNPMKLSGGVAASCCIEDQGPVWNSEKKQVRVMTYNLNKDTWIVYFCSNLVPKH